MNARAYRAAPLTGVETSEAPQEVVLTNIGKAFWERSGAWRPVLSDITLCFPPGSFTALVGPSGCGKSTLLSLIAGLDTVDAGAITIDGTTVEGAQRGTGFLFQRDALLPWRTVLDNVAFGLQLQGWAKRERLEYARSWIARVGLAGFERHYPSQLSGGMRKRVALAQVLAPRPRLLLMDEPYAALDVQTRALLENDLLSLVEGERGMTVLFVTHDLEEAIALSDRVILLGAGPGARVRADHAVPLPRPRDVGAIRSHPAFGEIYGALWEGLRAEVSATFAPSATAPEYAI